MKRVLQSWPILLLLCAASTSTHAQLYKWVGPDGKVTYSDAPPPPAVSSVESRALPSGGASTANLPFELAEAVKNYPVTLYTTSNCAPCDEGRTLLSQRGIPFTEKTVNTNDDVARLREVGGDGQLPFLTIGRSRERGYAAGSWNGALTAAGYPQTSRLPKSYRNPAAEAAAPAPKPATAKREEPSEQAAGSPPASDVPPATGNAPPGFRF